MSQHSLPCTPLWHFDNLLCLHVAWFAAFEPSHVVLDGFLAHECVMKSFSAVCQVGLPDTVRNSKETFFSVVSLIVDRNVEGKTLPKTILFNV
jgi:hypothetical protein